MPKSTKQLAPIPMSSEGMDLNQLLAMLQAAQSQGATRVQITCRDAKGGGIASDVDWVSMAPVAGVVYVGAILPLGKWSHASNEALESLDW